MAYYPSNLEEQLTLQQRIEYSGTNALYIGYADGPAAESDNAWLIKKYTYDSSDQVTKIVLADDSKAFNKSWTNRASYSYK